MLAYKNLKIAIAYFDHAGNYHSLSKIYNNDSNGIKEAREDKQASEFRSYIIPNEIFAMKLAERPVQYGQALGEASEALECDFSSENDEIYWLRSD